MEVRAFVRRRLCCAKDAWTRLTATEQDRLLCAGSAPAKDGTASGGCFCSAKVCTGRTGTWQIDPDRGSHGVKDYAATYGYTHVYFSPVDAFGFLLANWQYPAPAASSVTIQDFR
ncbi:hypothetical protein [Paenibacillus agricola]|uniref:Uncharacterized protein n=1 Tax=Paenibacillus agricola TaxID=2716264 RepID=A0ABX0J079_9BACL|nr:hypothetical protein [Paenibacillus agricola]NHN29226.1 hypothetical protein [Paenibacillus agricola]